MRVAPLTLLLLTGVCACADRATPDGPSTQAPARHQDASPSPAPVAKPGASPAMTQDIPVRFRGRYAADARSCRQTGAESALELQARRIEFHESSGEVLAVKVGGSEIAIDARMQGEGETSRRSYRYRLEAGDNTLVDADGGLRRVRCRAG